MTKKAASAPAETGPFWRVRIVLSGAILHVASRTEPRVILDDASARVRMVELDLITDADVGDTVGFVDWPAVVAVSWRYAAVAPPVQSEGEALATEPMFANRYTAGHDREGAQDEHAPDPRMNRRNRRRLLPPSDSAAVDRILGKLVCAYVRADPDPSSDESEASRVGAIMRRLKEGALQIAIVETEQAAAIEIIPRPPEFPEPDPAQPLIRWNSGP